MCIKFQNAIKQSQYDEKRRNFLLIYKVGNGHWYYFNILHIHFNQHLGQQKIQQQFYLQNYRTMNNPHYFQTLNNPINIPVSFSYSHNPIDNKVHTSPTFLRPNLPTVIHHNVPLSAASKTTSQIIYPTHTTPQFTSSLPFHHSQINQPKINVPQNTRSNVMVRNLSDYRRTVSPMNPIRVAVSPRATNLTNNKDLQKYDALRWQNKYEDLKTKYFQLLTIVQSHSNIEDSWLLEEENKLLRQKVKLLQEKDHKYYNQVAKRVEKMIDFHKQTTTQECALLIDRYRLETKYLEKI